MKHGLRKVLDQLRQSLDPAGVTDAQLLKRFIAERDEAAFAALVRRHGQMILGVCRRILGNPHDSEDAFQATFLVLAQKARSVVNQQAIASWLCTVAYRSALAAKKRNVRRQRKEVAVENMPHPEVPVREPEDWLPFLDDELNRLPEKYRAAVILCDLDGVARRDAARQLGLSEGTLSSRLARGRRLLAQKLVRHGITLSGGALATALSSQTVAAVPPALVSSTAQAAGLLAAGRLAAISTSVTTLAKGALTAMFLSKLKTFATVLVVVVLGAGTIFYSAGSAQAPPGKGKPRSELEALRDENELLKINLRVTLEKIRALESEVTTLKGGKKGVEASVLEALEKLGVEEARSRTAAVREKARADAALADKAALIEKVRADAALADNAALAKKKDGIIQNLDRILQDLDRTLKELRKPAPGNREALQRASEILEHAAKKLRQQEGPRTEKDQQRKH